MSGQDQFLSAVSAIYDAAVEPGRWDDALMAIADAMGATHTAIMVLEDGRLVDGSMPTMDPDHLKTYTEIKAARPQDELIVDAAATAIGQVVGFDDREVREMFENSYEFKEWWTQHDLGAGALFANLSLGGNRLAQVGVYRPQGEGFTPNDRLRLTQLCDHLVRAGRVERRLGTRESASIPGEDQSHVGLLVVDREYRVLSEPEQLARDFRGFGILAVVASTGKHELRSAKLKELVDAAQPPDRAGGSCSFTNECGERAWVDVAPIAEGNTRATGWLNLERPAALLHFTMPQKRTSLRVSGLAREFGLTPAERSVAIEIVKGDGRAATAQRLGISESTVRSHLSVIFEKVGIHRQSELIELVAG